MVRMDELGPGKGVRQRCEDVREWLYDSYSEDVNNDKYIKLCIYMIYKGETEDILPLTNLPGVNTF